MKKDSLTQYGDFMRFEDHFKIDVNAPPMPNPFESTMKAIYETAADNFDLGFRRGLKRHMTTNSSAMLW